jgi:hypothetical protein
MTHEADNLRNEDTGKPETGGNGPGAHIGDVKMKAPPPPLPQDAPTGAATFPDKFWPQIDYFLHHPGQTLESLRTDKELWRLSRIFLVITLAMAAIYGGTMGATNLLQGSTMLIGDKLLMIAVTAVKVPALFLVTLAIVLPPIYVSNAFMGARLGFRQMLALLLSSLTVTNTVLASTATVAFFFALTSKSYNFIKLLHVVFFGYAGMTGLAYLVRCVKTMATAGRKSTPQAIFVLWLVLYMFVGTQLAWVLRPFVGSPGMPFQFFRPRQGNFYESVLNSAQDLFNDD